MRALAAAALAVTMKLRRVVDVNGLPIFEAIADTAFRDMSASLRK